MAKAQQPKGRVGASRPPFPPKKKANPFIKVSAHKRGVAKKKAVAGKAMPPQFVKQGPNPPPFANQSPAASPTPVDMPPNRLAALGMLSSQMRTPVKKAPSRQFGKKKAKKQLPPLRPGASALETYASGHGG